jgi:hypothetical protein
MLTLENFIKYHLKNEFLKKFLFFIFKKVLKLNFAIFRLHLLPVSTIQKNKKGRTWYFKCGGGVFSVFSFLKKKAKHTYYNIRFVLIQILIKRQNIVIIVNAH